jgi:AraC-like DNA-binding protein
MPRDAAPVRTELRAYADVPGVRSLLVDADERLWCAVKETYAVALIHRGRAEFWSRRGGVASAPGDLHFDAPGSVHKDLRRDGPARFQIVTFDVALVREQAERRGLRPSLSLRVPLLERRHPDRRPLLALHRAYRGRPDPLTRQVVVAEALDALVRQLDGAAARPHAGVARGRLGRAVELIHARLGEALSLDELAAAAGLDRYQLCRAFRAEHGIPPYTYVLRMRMARAYAWLAAGRPVSEVASALGFCDQSQLHGHFRRAFGITPGAFARAARRGHAPLAPLAVVER